MRKPIRRSLGFLTRNPGLPLDIITNTHGTLPDENNRPGLHPELQTFDPTQFARELKSSIYRQGKLRDSPGTVGLTAVRVLEDDPARSYFFIQNQSAVDTVVVRFGAPPAIGSGGQFIGVAIAPNFGFWEPIMVPVQECWIIGSAASVPFVIVYGQ